MSDRMRRLHALGVGSEHFPWPLARDREEQASSQSRDSALGRTGGVLNRIEIEAEPVGTVAFSGPGAGGAATSSAILGDLLAIAREAGSTWAGLPIAGRLAPADRRMAPMAR